MLFNPYLFSLPCFYSLPLPPPTHPLWPNVSPIFIPTPITRHSCLSRIKAFDGLLQRLGPPPVPIAPLFFKDLPFNFRRPPPVSINVDFGRNQPEAPSSPTDSPIWSQQSLFSTCSRIPNTRPGRTNHLWSLRWSHFLNYFYCLLATPTLLVPL